MKLTKQSTVALAAAALLSVAVPLRQARADILPSALSPVVTAVSGGFNWDYLAQLTGAQQLQSGDFFVIYDFGPGSVVGSLPANWTLTSTDPFSPASVTGFNGTVTPTQTAALNYKFTYSGSTISGPQDLGHFVLFSTIGTATTAAWIGSAHDINNTDRINANITNANVPTTTPEPATFVLLGTAMLGLGGFVRRGKKSV